MKILFLVAHRRDRSPGQRFRFEQYLDYLTEQGFQCDFSPIIPTAQDDDVFYGQGNYFRKGMIFLNSIFIRLKDIRRANDYDIVFMYREALMIGSTFFEKQLAKTKAKLIVDFDDAVWLPVVSQNNRALAWLKRADKINDIMRLSDAVWVGNDYLAQYAGQFNENVQIVPTTVDTERFKPQPKQPHNTVQIGWTGSHSTLPHFVFLIPILEKLKEKYGNAISFKVIGDKNFKHQQLDIQAIAWTSESEVQELSTLDIGLMPLPDDEWTRGKCGLKGLTYMALEIPTVMSAVGVNKDIIQDGENGFLANTEAEWIEKLSLLIENPALRTQLGINGRETVVKHYSVVSQRPRYLEFLTQWQNPAP